MSEDSSCDETLSELKAKHEELIGIKHDLLQKLEDNERLKLDLRETRRGTKKLSNERDRLQALVDSKQKFRRPQQLHEVRSDSDIQKKLGSTSESSVSPKCNDEGIRAGQMAVD